MRDWKTLLAVPKFRALWFALICANLGAWGMMAALPILVSARFGAGGALVLSMTWRILPKILLAPLAGVLLRRFGAPIVVCLTLLGESVLTVILPWCEDFVLLQIVIAAIGALDVFVLPGLLSLRGVVTPAGFELAGNSLFSMADRLGKTLGPIIGGLAVLSGFGPAFACFAVATCLAALPVSGLPRPPSSNGGQATRALGMPREFWRMLRGDRVLTGLLVCAVSYSVMMGGLRPFLFWANREWFGSADAAWTGLMAAQGVGAIAGALVAGMFNRALLRHASAYTLTMLTGLLEGAIDLLLLFCPWGPMGPLVAMGLLALAGIPEVVSAATWFTAMQQRLPADRQIVFFAFTAPLWDCAFAIGVMSAGFHASGTLALGSWWTMLTLTATLPILPVLFWDRRRRSGAMKEA